MTTFKTFIESSQGESAHAVLQRLVTYRESLEGAEHCEVDRREERMILDDIERKLAEGWTSAEVFEYLKWSEYFDGYTHDESTCLDAMAKVKTRVTARLGAA